jgi:hypothetical protein
VITYGENNSYNILNRLKTIKEAAATLVRTVVQARSNSVYKLEIHKKLANVGAALWQWNQPEKADRI